MNYEQNDAKIFASIVDDKTRAQVEELRTKLDSLSKEDFKKVFDKYAVDFNEEPVSEDLEEAANAYAVTVYNNYLDNPKAFENKDADTLNEDAFKAGAKWQKQQIKKSMDLGEPPYLISVEQAYYRTVKLLED